MINVFNFLPYTNSPEVLADKVLNVFFGGKVPSFPIDPFKIIHAMGVFYQFKDFEELEGIYLVPEDDAASLSSKLNCSPHSVNNSWIVK